MHLHTRFIMASKCISKLAGLRPASAHDQGLQVHLQTRSITASKFAQSWPPCGIPPNSHNHGSKCISEQARLRHPSLHEDGLQVLLQTSCITISECISKFTRSRPPSVSLNTLDYRLQVHLQAHSIAASEYISEFTRSSFLGAPQIAFKHRLQPVQI